MATPLPLAVGASFSGVPPLQCTKEIPVVPEMSRNRIAPDPDPAGTFVRDALRRPTRPRAVGLDDSWASSACCRLTEESGGGFGGGGLQPPARAEDRERKAARPLQDRPLEWVPDASNLP